MFGGNQAARDAARLSRLEQLEKWRAEEAKDRQAKLAAAGGVPMTTGGNRSRRAEENLDDPSKPRFSIELTVLMAVRDRDLALATRLLKKGANPKAANQYGVSPLHLAVANDDRSMIEFLVNNGADIEAPDQDGFTPLHSAAHYGNNKGACVGGGARVSRGHRPLRRASPSGGPSACWPRLFVRQPCKSSSTRAPI